MESRKRVLTDLSEGQEQRRRRTEWTWGHSWGCRGWDELDSSSDIHSLTTMCEIHSGKVLHPKWSLVWCSVINQSGEGGSRSGYLWTCGWFTSFTAEMNTTLYIYFNIFFNHAGTTRYPKAKEWVWAPASHHIKILSKCINNLKYLEENLGINLKDPEFRNRFLRMTVKVWTKKEKTDWTSSKFYNSVPQSASSRKWTGKSLWKLFIQ